ncbi:methionine ABC transporter ATP-binding protein [Paraliobacillus sp. JSM ZJ581]|uniref:methionine ABC transporter ATP-binding protein n=1 Tax=Paraliobacillus sp. JSM ZJ581 TaxID=3342118 RepID=UPI0035A99211
MILLEQICKKYHREGQEIDALKDINIQVEQGDIFGVIGYSGAGKSTLVRLVNYLEKPTSGKVVVDGQCLNKLNKHQLRNTRKQIGMIFQNFNLLESKTISQNVAMPLILEKMNKNEMKTRVNELLQFVGLEDKQMSYPNELSGGQKQRVGIARALATNPRILLCDEATSALDPQTTQSILELLKKINKEYNITIMLITHEMQVIQQICNKVAVMEQGEVIEVGSVLDVFGYPEQLTTKKFVQTVISNKIPSSIKRKLKEKSEKNIYKLEMVGNHATKSILHQLIINYQLHLNVIYTNMAEIQETTLAIWYVQIEGEERTKRAAIDFLERQKVRIKEVTIE